MKKILILLMIAACLMGCQASPQQSGEPSATPEVIEKKTLPEKSNPESTLMSESPITPTNLDEYLFLDGVTYIDTRSPNQFIEEGHVAGFTNLPFYEFLVSYKPTENILFTMDTVKDENGKVTIGLGEVGSFKPTYEESESILKDLFPKNKPIVFISTAGVEATYLMNLLIQYGYDAANLYNAGTFSNGMGNIIAYKDYTDAKYYVPGTNVYKVNTQVDWGELTPITE